MKNRFQSLPFKCNLQRYIVDKGPAQLPFLAVLLAAGLYTLNPVSSFKGLHKLHPETHSSYSWKQVWSQPLHV